MHIDLNGGGSRQWYAGADGVKRWVDNDAPLGTFSGYMANVSEMRPDDLDVLDLNNNAIEPIRDSAIAAEDAGQMPRTNYTDGSK